MSKIKVPMQLRIEQLNTGQSFRDPYGLNKRLRVHLTPVPICREYVSLEGSSVDYVKVAFKECVKQFQSVDIQILFAIEHLLKSARVENAFDMLTLNEQLLPMLEEVIAQVDPDNYELEIIK